jgi:YVTN family beta-propeller protein
MKPTLDTANRRAQQRGHRRRVWFASALATSFLLVLASNAGAHDAYVANRSSENVSVIDTGTNQTVAPPVAVQMEPRALAITPDGRTAYVANYESASVSTIDTQLKLPIGLPIPVAPGSRPDSVAVAPDGKDVYVGLREREGVVTIDAQTNQIVGALIPIGARPDAIAITPDGRTVYVVTESDTVAVIDVSSRQMVGAPIPVGKSSDAIAIAPDGKTAYVTDGQAESVSVIDTATNRVTGSIGVGKAPSQVAIAPDGRTAYVANTQGNTVSVIDTATNQALGSTIAIEKPVGIAIAPDGKTAYVTTESGNVRAVDTKANQVVGAPIAVEKLPVAIAIAPDQPPLASFSAPAAGRPGVPLAFDAGGSRDPDGTIAGYGWAFGDGGMGIGARLSHAYSRPGTYAVKLTLTDNEGCSTAFVFTGQTASCNGSALASQTHSVKVAYPGVRVRCPKRAKAHGCKFRLRAVAKRHGKAKSAIARAESKVTVAKLKRGRSAIVSLRPLPAFRSRLAVAPNVLVEERVTIDGVKRTRFGRLRIVQ